MLGFPTGREVFGYTEFTPGGYLYQAKMLAGTLGFIALDDKIACESAARWHTFLLSKKYLGKYRAGDRLDRPHVASVGAPMKHSRGATPGWSSFYAITGLPPRRALSLQGHPGHLDGDQLHHGSRAAGRWRDCRDREIRFA